MRANPSICKCLPFALALITILVTGCPHNDYTIELKPHGKHIERTLVFYRADDSNTNKSTPNYQAFDAAELATITALYPAGNLTNEGGRYVIRGEFTDRLPDDVGGVGVYTNLASSLGEAGFYVERFRGNDDLAGLTEQRFKAAGQLTDLLIGWSQAELGREPGYEQLHQFLAVEFRRDLKNVSSYWWEGELAGNYKTNASEEFLVRFGQYLFERGYFKIGEIPGLFQDADKASALLPRLQRLVARKMGIPDTEPLPASLDFLGNETQMEKSLTNFLAGTEAYRARLKQWAEDKKLQPDAKQPDPLDLIGDVTKNLLNFEFFQEQPDHLNVRLALPAPPVHSNGRWDTVLKEVIWDTDLMGKTNVVCLPVSCYATWAQPDEAFQKAHFGPAALSGDELIQYCLWRSAQDARRGDEWDAFLAGLQPGPGLAKRIDAFRFSDEKDADQTNGPQNIAGNSAVARELLINALKLK